MSKRWRIAFHDENRIRQLEQTAGVSPVVAQLLINRGLDDPQTARQFLDAKLSSLRDPNELPGCQAAAQRLASAIGQGRKIVVYGDYDADGMTATAILIWALRLLGAPATFHVPNRIDDGYGLSIAALEKLAQAGAQTIVTVDCGITSVAEAQRARELGLELIVTDHHEMGPQLPAADVLVHPALPEGNYPFHGLCGAAVALKLAWALCIEVSGQPKVPTRMRNMLLACVGLAALGTVADVVPLVDENRALVRHGLGLLRERALPGIAALQRVAKLQRKPALSSEDLAFSLAPRLNAAGRLGQAPLAVELLTTGSADRAAELADYLDELNAQRVSLERSVYLAANKQVQAEFDPAADPALVLADEGWHPGVIGIVAGRLADKYHRPVVVVSFDPLGVKPGIGSARSIPGFALHEALAACGEHLLGHGGHAAAAGVQVAKGAIQAFRTAFCDYAAEQISGDQLAAEIKIDAEAPFTNLSQTTVEQIEQLAPFGQGNRRPILCTSGVTLEGPARKMGGGDRHVAMTLNQHGISLRAVAFGRGDWAEPLSALDEPFSIAFQPVINTFGGRHSVELHLTDWQPSEHPAPATDAG